MTSACLFIAISNLLGYSQKMLMYLSCGWRHAPDCPPPKTKPLSRRTLTYPDGSPEPWVASATKAHNPLPLVHERHNWEIYAVIRGKLALQSYPPSSGSNQVAYQELTLWVTPPGSRHQWLTPPGTACEVLVFHFAELPSMWKEVLGTNKFSQINFKRKEAALLLDIFERLIPHYRQPKLYSPLVFEACACELGAFYLAHHDTLGSVPVFDTASHKVATALNWYRDHLDANVTVHDAAKAIGVSTGYLRRLAQQVHGKSTKALFTEIAMDRARQLLVQPGLSMKEVAVQCGFNAYSQFYRAFQKHYGITPTEWVRGTDYGENNSLNVSYRQSSGSTSSSSKTSP